MCVLCCRSYHGLGVWFPDTIKYMQFEEYEAKARTFHRERVEHFHFNFSLVNQLHHEGEYIHDKCVLRAASLPPLARSRFPGAAHLALLLSFQV